MALSVRTIREDHKAITKNRLIESGRRLFETHGYAATSASDIAREAGVSRTTFYLHFNNKAEVLAEVFKRYHVSLVVDLLDSFGDNDLTYPSIQRWIEGYADTYRDTRLVMRAWLQGRSWETAGLRDVYDMALERLISGIASRIVNHAAAHGRVIVPEDARTRALLMFSELERFCYYLFIHHNGISREPGLSLIGHLWVGRLAEDGYG